MKNKRFVALLLSGAIIFSSAALLGGCGKNTDSKKKETVTEEATKAPEELSFPYSGKEMIGMDYDDLYNGLAEAGFTDVSSDALDDLTSSKDRKNETVKKVTIDGKENFKKGDSVMSDASITISYHSVKDLYPPVDNEDIKDKEMDYEDVVTQYEKEGFTNITTKPVVDSSKPEGTVKKISIDGETDYLIIYPADAKVVISYYTKGTSAIEPKQSSSKKSSNSDSDFKELMDTYEAFFNDYVDFMKKYKDNPNDLSLLGDYADYISKYTDYMEKLEDVDKDKLTTDEALYYTEVSARILKKLAEIQ